MNLKENEFKEAGNLQAPLPSTGDQQKEDLVRNLLIGLHPARSGGPWRIALPSIDLI